jgi:hypothetical protein
LEAVKGAAFAGESLVSGRRAAPSFLAWGGIGLHNINEDKPS